MHDIFTLPATALSGQTYRSPESLVAEAYGFDTALETLEKMHDDPPPHGVYGDAILVSPAHNWMERLSGQLDLNRASIIDGYRNQVRGITNYINEWSRIQLEEKVDKMVMSRWLSRLKFPEFKEEQITPRITVFNSYLGHFKVIHPSDTRTMTRGFISLSAYSYGRGALGQHSLLTVFGFKNYLGETCYGAISIDIQALMPSASLRSSSYINNPKVVMVKAPSTAATTDPLKGARGFRTPSTIYAVEVASAKNVSVLDDSNCRLVTDALCPASDKYTPPYLLSPKPWSGSITDTSMLVLPKRIDVLKELVVNGDFRAVVLGMLQHISDQEDELERVNKNRVTVDDKPGAKKRKARVAINLDLVPRTLPLEFAQPKKTKAKEAEVSKIQTKPKQKCSYCREEFLDYEKCSNCGTVMCHPHAYYSPENRPYCESCLMAIMAHKDE